MLLSVIEQTTVPESMLSTRAIVEEARVSTVELVQTVQDILRCVRVYHI